MFNTTIILLIVYLALKKQRKYFYNSIWFNHTLGFDNIQFKEYFRLSKKQFFIISEDFYNKQSSYRSKQHLQEDMLMFLGYIGHGDSYRGLRELFGVPKTTYHRRVEEFTNVVFMISNQYISLPSDAEFGSLARNFSEGSLFNIIMAIDGTHLEITAPDINERLWCNRKGYHSINCLAVIDFKKKFRFASINYGSAHDARCFINSGALVNFCNNLNVYKIVGDRAFQSQPGIEYVKTAPEPSQAAHYKQLNSIRINIENTFGMFKKSLKSLKEY